MAIIEHSPNHIEHWEKRIRTYTINVSLRNNAVIVKLPCEFPFIPIFQIISSSLSQPHQHPVGYITPITVPSGFPFSSLSSHLFLVCFHMSALMWGRCACKCALLEARGQSQGSSLLRYHLLDFLRQNLSLGLKVCQIDLAGSPMRPRDESVSISPSPSSRITGM